MQPNGHLGVIILGAGASSRMGRPKLLLPWDGTTVIGRLIAQWRELGAGQIAVVRRPEDAALMAELDRLGLPKSGSENPETGNPQAGSCFVENLSAKQSKVEKRPRLAFQKGHCTTSPQPSPPFHGGEGARGVRFKNGFYRAAGSLRSGGIPVPVDQIINPQPERGMFSSIICAANWDGWRGDITNWAIVLGDQPHLQTETLRSLLNFSGQNRDAICQPTSGGRTAHPVILPRPIFDALKDPAAATLKEFLKLAACPGVQCVINDPGLTLDLDTPEDYKRLQAQQKRI